MREFAIRIKNRSGSLISIVEDIEIPELIVEEVCAVCHRQGVIHALHLKTEDHAGTPYFRLSKAWALALKTYAEEILKDSQ